MNEDMRTLTCINSVAMSLFGAAMGMFGEWGISTVAFVSALANATVLLMEDVEEKKKRFEGGNPPILR